MPAFFPFLETLLKWTFWYRQQLLSRFLFYLSSAERIWFYIRLNNAAKWACDREDADHLFRWSSFWSWRVCKQGKFSHLGHRKRARIHKPTHRKRFTVWCAFWSRGIIWPFFFRNEQGEAIAVNGDRYRAMLNEFLFTKIEEEDIGNIWCQQDGATFHTAEATLDVLRPVFEDCIISRRADVIWPSRTGDLTSLDYYLCRQI